MTSSEVLPPGSFLRLSPFLQKGGMPLEDLGMPLCASRGFCSPSAQLGPAGGWLSLVARSVHASSLLSPRFIRGLWIQELLSCGELLLLFLSRLALPPHLCTLDEVMGWESLRNFFSMFSVVSPASSLHARQGGEAGETSKCRSS